MTSFAQAWRALARRPVFTAAVLLTMTAGIGVTTALFSVVDRVVVRPLPYPDGDRLVALFEASPTRQQRESLIAPVRIGDWNRLSRAFDLISGSYSENVTDTSGQEPERLQARRVMPRFLDVFAMRPLAGRTFTADEERDGGPTAAVISEGFWTRRFNRDPSAVGRRLTIAGRGYTIVGVMPAAFAPPSLDVWIPAQLGAYLLQIRDARFLTGVGRMRRGVTVEQAQRDLADVQRRLGEQYPKTDKDWSVQVRDLKEMRVGEYRRALVLLFGAVAALLLIAIANVAGLMLVQLRRRAAEFAIRSAIGASHRQVVAVVMREVALLAGLSAIAGTFVAAWLTRAMATATAFAAIPRMPEATLDRRALVFALGASAVAAIAFGVVPAIAATRRQLMPVLASGGRGVSGGRHRLQGALVVAQIALSVMLAGGAGLLIRSYGALTRVSSGFNASNTVTFHVGAAWDEDRNRIRQLQARLVSELQQLPGVRDAGFANFLPATGATLRYAVRVDGINGPEEGGTINAGERTVTPGYLRALQVPLVAGEWCPEIRADSTRPLTAMVNQKFVDVYANGQNLIGRNLTVVPTPSPWRIVGVTGNVIEDGPAVPAAPYVYVCMPAGSWPDPEYVVRADGDPRATIGAIKQLVRSIDPTRPLFGIRSVEEIVDQAFDQPRLNAQFLTTFAGAALALAALGLYGLLTLLVAERRRELGVRIALGASSGDLVRLVLAGAGRLVALGMAGGVLLMLAANQALRAVVFGITIHDARALIGGVLALGVVSACAIAVPARQAATVSPIEAIRAD